LQMRKEIPSYKNAWNFMTSCKPVSFWRTLLHGVNK
jgi:hypothetical protein